MRLPPGIFGWVDLATSDVDRAKDFYSGLLAWEFEAIPTPMGVPYTMCRLDGKQVAGIGPQPPGMAEAGVPPAWNSYVIVESADASTAAAVDAGGAVVMPAMDVMTQGRMAMIADPGGAVLGVWEPRDHQGAEVFNVPGALTWNELQTRDLASAMPFYESVFGWRWEEVPDSGGYQVINLDTKEGPDTSNGGAMTLPEEVPPEVPCYWAVYFAVEDCEESTAMADRLGGKVFLPPMPMGPGMFSGIEDPAGAILFIGHFNAE
jgi:predicted enzyme related to lactoylglutathione lyase